MINKTRKRFSPMLLVMSLAVVGVLAAFIAVAAWPGATEAHGPNDHANLPACADMTTAQQAIHDNVHAEFGEDGCPDGTDPVPGTDTGTVTGPNVNATKPSPPVMMSISRPTDNQARPVLPGDGELMIKWERPNHRNEGRTPITGYDVRYTMTPADDDSWNSANDLPANKTSYVITGLTNGETYHVEVRAKNRLGYSLWSASRSGVPVAVPSAPMSLSVEGSESRIVVSWDAPASSGDHPIDRYNWDVDDVATNGQDSSGTFGSRQFRTMDMQMFFPQSGGAIITSVASDGEGCLEVTASASNATHDDPDGSTRSLPGYEAMVTCAGAPTLTKQMVDNVAILRWDEPSLKGGAEVTEYVVRRLGYERINPTDTTLLGNLLGPEYREWHLDGSERSMWDTGLSHQTGYIYTIYAITDRYDLGYEPDRYKVSDRVTAFTSTDGGLILAPPSGPNAATGLTLASQCADQITLTWTAPTQVGGGVDPRLNRDWSHGKIVVGDAATIDHYEVQYRERGSWMDLVPRGRRADVSTDLSYDKTYEFRVRATNNIGLFGPWASKMIELEDPGRPQIPRSLNVDPIAANTVELEWLAPIDDATPPLWRTQADFDLSTDASRNLQYQIERQLGATGSWAVIAKPYHQYGESLSDHRTQGYTDYTAPAGNVNYRVAALVNDCNESDYSQKDEIVVAAAVLTLGTPASVTATSRAAGAITVSYIAGVNATGHLIILAQGSTLVDFDVRIDGSDASFSNVAAGNYTAIVVSFRRMGGILEFKHSPDTVTVN